MTYRRVFYIHEDDAHAALCVLEAFGFRGGIIATTVAHVRGEDVTDSTEWEVWIALPEERGHTASVMAATELDEHDVGRSTLWDEEAERRASRE